MPVKIPPFLAAASATQRAEEQVARRFKLSAAEVRDIVHTDLGTLRDRDRFVPRSNATEPETAPPLPIGAAKIAYWQADPTQAYVEVLREFDPNTIEPSEQENGIRRHPTFDRYVRWWKAGHVPPPVSVFESHKGDGRLITSNRRRTLTAREAGVPSVPGWLSPNNLETGLPLKYGDVLRGYEEALQLNAHGPVDPQEPVFQGDDETVPVPAPG